MAGKDLWKSDWFLRLVVVAIAVFLLSATDLVGSLERKAYDLGVRASTREPSGDIAVIAIDVLSIANVGRCSSSPAAASCCGESRWRS